MNIILLLLISFVNIISQSESGSLMTVNKIKIHIGNSGELGAGFVGQKYGGVFEGESFLYSSGFYLAGKAGNVLWGNGVFLSDHNMNDYLPGNVDSNSTLSKYKVYVVKSEDPDFGESWQEWRQAVEIGAIFYDGDGDGSYNPIDKNGNGKWDENEDKPDIIGDYTAWCVFNDSKVTAERKYKNVSPMGIEIKETVFAWDSAYGEPLSNTFFVRYIVENTGKFYETFDSVFFGIATDPDLGINYSEDYTGTDTVLQSVFAYKNAPDDTAGYGDNPPAFSSVLLHGPQVYIPNETYLDLNSNGIFDEDYDQALESAVIKRGELLGEKIVYGARNLNLTSTSLYLKSWNVFGEPDNESELFNYLIGGRLGSGIPLDVSSFDAGNGSELGAAADTINPKFMFSGNPLNKTGWLCTQPWDYRMVLSTGPFTLRAGEPVEILVAYVVGRGSSPMNSLQKSKGLTDMIIQFYNSNFAVFPLSVNEKTKAFQNNFVLYQNYPNPFNPATVIKYVVPQVASSSSLNVSLNVYDVLGREVATLLNKKQPAGTYRVTFDVRKTGIELTSGIYFYKLTAGNFHKTRKMILLK